MGGNLRILHTSDSHIGAELPVRPRVDRPRRGDDFVDSFGRVLDRALSDEVDLVIHSGDLFNRSKPSSRALTAAAEPLLKVAVAGIPIVIVPGNHERSTIPVCVLLSHANIHIISEPRTLEFALRGLRVAVSGFPCLRRNSAGGFAVALAATDWVKACADVRILAVHQTFESATCGPANHRFRTGDDVVERTEVPPEFDYVAAGHIHRHQVLAGPGTDGPPIVYSGSPDRISFAEIDEPKGHVLIEWASGRLRHSLVEHDVRLMSVHPMDVSALSRRRIEEKVSAILEALPPGAMLQLRLAGSTGHGALRGLRLGALANRLRPDVLFSVSMRAVEFGAPPPTPRATGGSRSTYSQHDDPHAPAVTVRVDDVTSLPTGNGVYALHDEDGRLLYIGKSRNVRTRVRSHLRGGGEANFFSGWTRQVRRIEARPTHSELEALLLEAELIRALSPPFNRQMRRWRKYCYLCENGKPVGQLVIRSQPSAGSACFGPFRSRQFAAAVRDALATHFGLALCADEKPTTEGLMPAPAEWESEPLAVASERRASDSSQSFCTKQIVDHISSRAASKPSRNNTEPCIRYHKGLCVGPCVDSVRSPDYDSRLQRRDAVLSGLDDSDVCELELQLETAPDEPRSSGDDVDDSHRAWILRTAFDQAATLRRAEQMMHGLLLLPGPVGSRTSATLSTRGVRFDVLRDNPTDAERVLRRRRRLMNGASTRVSRLPKTSMDSLCIVARQLSLHCESDSGYDLLRESELSGLDARGLLERAFE